MLLNDIIEDYSLLRNDNIIITIKQHCVCPSFTDVFLSSNHHNVMKILNFAFENHSELFSKEIKRIKIEKGRRDDAMYMFLRFLMEDGELISFYYTRLQYRLQILKMVEST